MRARLILSSLLLASLAGCGGGSDFADLQSYMDEVRARPKGTIEPLPKFQPYEAFTYSAASLRSPFQPPVKIDLTVRQKGNKVIKPDETRASSSWKASTSRPSRWSAPCPTPRAPSPW